MPRYIRRFNVLAMIQIKRILVPSDFSEPARKALIYAAEFAVAYEAEIILCHVMEPPIYPVSISVGAVSVPPIGGEMRQHTTEQLELLRATELGDLIPSRTIVAEGKPFLEIIQLARSEDADMIIISTHGHTGLKHVLVGSTTEKVVRKAPCPVLCVREKEKEFVKP